MANTTPNKESVRRICILHGGSFCYLNIHTGEEHVDVLTNIQNERLKDCVKELEAWCGMKFRVLNDDSPESERTFLISKGEKILPIKTA